MATEFALDPRDREKHGGPEWVAFDRDQLDDQPLKILIEWEQQLGVSLTALLAHELPRQTALGWAGIVWVARKLSGVPTSPFAEFDIRPRKVRIRKAADAVPPSPGSSEPSPEEVP